MGCEVMAAAVTMQKMGILMTARETLHIYGSPGFCLNLSLSRLEQQRLSSHRCRHENAKLRLAWFQTSGLDEIFAGRI